jgi:hypothetical protein
VAMIAFWWNDWPGSQLTTPWTGLVDTVLVVGAAVVLTIAGQAIVERPDLRGVFEASPGPGIPTTFPATLAVAGAAFTAMLQLSLVCERWPLAGLGRLRSGIAALALAWGVGIGAYFLFVNLNAVPAAARAAAGLRNPGGPVPGPDFGSALIAVGVWQAVFFIVLRGWPVNTMSRQARRLITGNVLVIGLGAATYLVLRDGAGLQPGNQRRDHRRHALRGLARRPAVPRPRTRPRGLPHGSCGCRAQPRPGRLCRRRRLG